MGGLVRVEERIEPLSEEERRRGAGDGHGQLSRGFMTVFFFLFLFLFLFLGLGSPECRWVFRVAKAGRVVSVGGRRGRRRGRGSENEAGRDARHEPFACLLSRSLSWSDWPVGQVSGRLFCSREMLCNSGKALWPASELGYARQTEARGWRRELELRWAIRASGRASGILDWF